MTKYLAEFLGTAILIILGNGAVANVDLKGTKGFASGWMTIAWGYGCGTCPACELRKLGFEAFSQEG